VQPARHADALAGLALGYLYVKYGFHTNVLLHWSVNYVVTIFSFLGQGLLGVSWTSNAGSFLDVVPTFDIVILLGIPSTLIVANELLKLVLGVKQSGPLSSKDLRLRMSQIAEDCASDEDNLNEI